MKSFTRTIACTFLATSLCPLAWADFANSLFYANNTDSAIADRFLVICVENAFDSFDLVDEWGRNTTGRNDNFQYGQAFFNGGDLQGFTMQIPLQADISDAENDEAKEWREGLLETILGLDLVDWIEQEQVYRTRATTTQTPTRNWGLDRIDQDALPLNNEYRFEESGAGVTAYILDTGILSAHVDFQGRVTCGLNMIAGETCEDQLGHGTHVAGIVGSSTFGVAKNVDLVTVKVLGGEDGTGTTGGIIAGLDFVIAEKQSKGGPMVANASLGGGISRALNRAARALVNAGVFLAAAAGNEGEDACNASPASESFVMSVGASDEFDARATFSNFGSCVDIFGPGVEITSTFSSSNEAVNTISGTSMASPHVAGVAALYLEEDPDATPAEVASLILQDATTGRLSDLRGSPNLLLNTESLLPGGTGADNSANGASAATTTATRIRSGHFAASLAACLLL